MDSWPADYRVRARDGTQRRGSSGNRTASSYPRLVFGALNALNLCETGSRLEWTSFVKRTGNHLTTNGDYIDVFPPSRPPHLVIPRMTVTQRSELGANFLRTHIPDIDIASDLIRDQLTADALVVNSIEDFDPQLGNLLDVVYFPGAPPDPIACLAFPMGELHRDLNISPFTHSKNAGTVFKPSAAPIRTFDTPIQQIVSSNSSLNSQIGIGRTHQHLAVRTFASTSILDLKARDNTSSNLPPSFQLTEVAKITSSDVGNKPVVDINVSCSILDGGVLVNEIGEVYKYSINDGRKILRLARPLTQPHTTNQFWRLALTETSQSCFLASNKSVKLVDFRIDDSCLDLFSVQNDTVTSIGRPGSDHIFPLATTSEILWIDERFPQKPLLAYMHGRQFDRSLGLLTIDLPTPSTLLTSRRNALVTVYDVSRSHDDLIHVNNLPYPLTAVLGCSETHTGHVLVRHPSYPGNTEVGLFRLCGRGSIHNVTLQKAIEDEHISATRHCTQIYDWSESIKELQRKSIELRPDVGPSGMRRFIEVNLHDVYKRLLLVEENFAETNSKVVCEKILDRIPTFWQESSRPQISMLIMFDIAFRSGEISDQASRANFLTPCAINTVTGYQALLEGRICPTSLIQPASWSYKIHSILAQLDVEIAENPIELTDNLHFYDLNLADLATGGVSHARENLALDLALSANIFSSRQVSNPSHLDFDELETMSRAAGALSLGDEPSALQFGYLQPVPKGDDEEASQEGLAYPAGVRILLDEWEIGTDPDNYDYAKVYDGIVRGDVMPNAVTPRAARRPPRESEGRLVRKRQQPPPVVSSSVVAQTTGVSRSRDAPMNLPAVRSTSQPALANSEIGESQRVVTSTQVLPGVYGGRVPQSKKKVGKRIDGF